jgi:hypothetical protein
MGFIYLLDAPEALIGFLDGMRDGNPRGTIECRGGREYSVCTQSADWGEVKALLAGNIKVCDELDFGKDSCSLRVAAAVDDKAICDQFGDAKPLCLSRYAVRHQDVQGCIEIAEKRKSGAWLAHQGAETDCFTGVALGTKDIRVCDAFARANGADRLFKCHKSCAIEFGDKAICEALSDDIAKKDCSARVDAARQYPKIEPGLSYHSITEFYATSGWSAIASTTKDLGFCEYERWPSDRESCKKQKW